MTASCSHDRQPCYLLSQKLAQLQTIMDPCEKPQPQDTRTRRQPWMTQPRRRWAYSDCFTTKWPRRRRQSWITRSSLSLSKTAMDATLSPRQSLTSTTSCSSVPSTSPLHHPVFSQFAVEQQQQQQQTSNVATAHHSPPLTMSPPQEKPPRPPLHVGINN